MSRPLAMSVFAWTRGYQPSWLRSDLSAGVVLAALLVPVGMGYAQASGLPAVTGLYATIGPLLVYAALGPSRILVLGPDSSLAPLIAATVLPLAAGDPEQAVPFAATLALLAGGLCVLMGLTGFGFLATLLSRPVRVGYLDGIAVTVIVSQLPALFGFPSSADSVTDTLAGFIGGVRDGLTQPLALAIGTAALAIILLCRRFAPSLPGILIAVVAATLLVAVAGLADQLEVVGALPQGLPPITLPRLDPQTLSALLPAAIGIALVSFADTSVLSRSFARRGDRVPDQDRELIALGTSDAVAGLISGFPVSASASRTPVARAAGSRTQLTGVVAALLLVVMLVAIPGLLADLPEAALAAVVIAAGLSLFDLAFPMQLLRMRPMEFVLLIVAFLGVVLVGVLQGVVIAVVLSLLEFVRRAWRPHDAVLGRVPGRKGYHDAARHPDIRFVPELVMYRWDAPLFFANADLFRERAMALVVGTDGMPVVRTLVVSAEPITDIDATAAEIFVDLIDDLAAMGVRLDFAELKGPVKDRLRRYGIYDRLGDEGFHPTVGAAVKAHVARTGVIWSDPEA